MKHTRIMKMNKILRGTFGVFKSEMIYEYRAGIWWLMPVSWYNAR
jgi:hypothetical protein